MSGSGRKASGQEASGPRSVRVREKLTEFFGAQKLEIFDESSRHAHHAPMARGPEENATETHFRLLMVSPAFEGVSRVNRFRKVHEILQPEFDSGLHALAMVLRTPEEDAACPT